MEEEYLYYEVNYISCEGNERWTIARTPSDWSTYDVADNLQLGGYGDDISTLTSIELTTDTNYSFDYVG